MDMRGALSSFRPLVLGAAIIVAVLLFVGIRQASALLARPSFCASCHVMSAQYISQQRSRHARASCVDCHSGSRCGSCHTAAEADDAMARRRVNSAAIRLHEAHARSAASCETCHVGIMHSRIDGIVRRSPWEFCGGCHGQTALESTVQRRPGRMLHVMEGP